MAFIVPDLPPEEADELEQLTAESGLALVHFIAPTSNQSRMVRVAAQAQGFYLFGQRHGGDRGKEAGEKPIWQVS